jgi:hypothetical protein
LNLVFEPPDLSQTRIDAAFRDRAPRIGRIGGAEQIVVEADQTLSGIGLMSNADARFAAPETISAEGRFEDVRRGGHGPEQHLNDMALDGLAGQVLYPSQGLFYFKVADPLPMSAIFRAYYDWLADPGTRAGRPSGGCRTDPARLKGIAMINLDDVPDAIKELERAARLGLSRAMITEYPAEEPLRPTRVRAVLGRRRTRPAAEPAHGDASAGQDPRGRRQDIARRQQPCHEGVLSGAVDVRSDLLRRLRASSPPHAGHRGVRAGLGAPPALDDGLHLPRAPRRGDLPVQAPALAEAGDGMLPSDFFHRNVVLSFQEDAIGIRLPPPFPPRLRTLAGEGQGGGVDNMMWGSYYPHSESTFPQSRKILAEILAGVPDDEQAKPAPDPDPGIAAGNTARVYNFDVARLTVPAWRANLSADRRARRARAVHGGRALPVLARRGAALAEPIIILAEMPDSSIRGMRIGYVYADR